MTLDEYQAEAKRTSPRSMDAYPAVVRTAAALLGNYDTGDREALLKLQDVHIWAHGLAGEAGEVCDLLKKVHGHGKAYDRDQMRKELGDVLWYLAAIAGAHGFKLSEVAEANVEKLRARHPNGFTVATAAAKADEAPAARPRKHCVRCYNLRHAEPECIFCADCCAYFERTLGETCNAKKVVDPYAEDCAS